MDWVSLDQFVQHLEGEAGTPWQARATARAAIYAGEYIAEGKRVGETVAGYVRVPRTWFRPDQSGMIGVGFIDWDSGVVWQNTIRGTCDAYVDVRVREANARLDVTAAIRKLHAEGMRPGAGMPWELYIRAIKELTGRRYVEQYLRRRRKEILGDRT